MRTKSICAGAKLYESLLKNKTFQLLNVNRVIRFETYDLNFTVVVRYWNRIKHCTKTERRKLASDNCSASNFGFVRNLAKKCGVSSISVSIDNGSMVFGADAAWLLPLCSSSLKLLNADRTLVRCCKEKKSHFAVIEFQSNWQFNLPRRMFSIRTHSIDLDCERNLAVPKICNTNCDRFWLRHFPIRCRRRYRWLSSRTPSDFPNWIPKLYSNRIVRKMGKMWPKIAECDRKRQCFERVRNVSANRYTFAASYFCTMQISNSLSKLTHSVQRTKTLPRTVPMWRHRTHRPTTLPESSTWWYLDDRRQSTVWSMLRFYPFRWLHPSTKHREMLDPKCSSCHCRCLWFYQTAPSMRRCHNFCSILSMYPANGKNVAI